MQTRPGRGDWSAIALFPYYCLLRRAGFSGHRPRRDKDRQNLQPESRRERTTQSPPWPLNRAAGKAGRPRSCEGLDRPSSIVAPNRRSTIPLKRIPRPAPVKLRRAGFSGHRPRRDKDRQNLQPESRRERTTQSPPGRSIAPPAKRVDPVAAKGSTARAPSSPRNRRSTIPLKRIPRPAPVKLRRAGFSGHRPRRDKDRQNLQPESRRERTTQSPPGRSIAPPAKRVDPVAAKGSTARAPSSPRNRRSTIPLKRIPRPAPVKLRRAGFSGHRPRRDKDRQNLQPESRRERTTQVASAAARRSSVWNRQRQAAADFLRHFGWSANIEMQRRDADRFSTVHVANLVIDKKGLLGLRF